MANEEKKESKVEVIKRNSRHLRATISEALQDGTSHFSEDNIQVLKFHGMYQQDDRDLRPQLKKEGREKHYMMMIRARIPGGVLTPEAYLGFDEISNLHGNQTMRITTRQTFQLHGILKDNLKSTMVKINEQLITTLGGCGDQVRNIIGCASPVLDEAHVEIREDLLLLVDKLGAKTNAYHEIWLDGEKVDFETEDEPLYGDVYLPRKFKLALTVEGDNCCDVYANDLGIVAHPDGQGHVEGYTLLVGGGMGRTATIKDTYPRVASPIAYVSRDELVDTCYTIVTIQRDYGNRSDRRYSRFKYLLDDKGLDWFKAELDTRMGNTLAPPRELVWTNAADHLGWHAHGDNMHYLGLFVENGRIAEFPQMRLKSVLRDIVAEFRPTIRLTTQQNLILCDLSADAKAIIEAKLRDAGVKLVEEIPATVLHAMACPALPTCGLATAESERIFPSVLDSLHQLVQEVGIADEIITFRMTGCSNGCARPYVADVGFVGRTPGKYDLFLAGDFYGTRLNQLYQEMVPMESFTTLLRPMLEAFRTNRQSGERFGDYCHRVGLDYLRNLAEPANA